MTRTQIYLTEHEATAIARLARERGATSSELIREAIDAFLERKAIQPALKRLQAGKGIWKGRPALDLRALRGELDRGFAPASRPKARRK